MMKSKHNKKRNVAFVYEALVNVITTAVIKKEQSQREMAIDILKEFYKNTEIAKEHEIYTTILECENLDAATAEKIIAEAKRTHDKLDKQNLLKEEIYDAGYDLERFTEYISNIKQDGKIYISLNDFYKQIT